MTAHPRIEEYHRRRQRLARRRRSSGRSRPHRLTLVPPGELLPPCRFLDQMDGNCRDSLIDLAHHACSYPAVTSLLLLCRGDRIQVCIVAERPMTKPLRMLADTWRTGLGEAHPGITWSLKVTAQPPSPEQHYQYLYWCRH